MFIRLAAVSACVLAFSGCGGSTTPSTTPANQNAAPVGANANANANNNANLITQGQVDPHAITPPSAEDLACQKALSMTENPNGETYCKENRGFKVCQSLYVSPDGAVLYDQRVNEDIDKTDGTTELSCAAAMEMFKTA